MARGTNKDARKKVTKALASAGSAAVGSMVDAANASKRKRLELKAEREKAQARNEASKGSQKVQALRHLQF